MCVSLGCVSPICTRPTGSIRTHVREEGGRSRDVKEEEKEKKKKKKEEEKEAKKKKKKKKY